MQPIKEPERSAAAVALGRKWTEGNGPKRTVGRGLLRKWGWHGRPAARILFLGCMLPCLLLPAEMVRRGNPPAGQILSKGPPAFPFIQRPQCLRKGWEPVPPNVLVLKRPRPGSIWQGPQEVWCMLPQRQEAGGLRPAEATPPEGTPPEGTPPEGTPPEASPPPPPPAYLSPLLFFLMTLPSLEEVASYFAVALGETPTIDGPQTLRFERLLAFVWGKSWRRCILSGGARGAPGVTLDWWTNDDFGLSELREFFEAPFFRRCESVRFHQWLGQGGAHEADFRGHRLRMVMGKRDGVFFVRIQWWRSAPDADGSRGLLDFDTLEQTSSLASNPEKDAVYGQASVLPARNNGQSQTLLRHGRYAWQRLGCPQIKDKAGM